MSYHQIDRTTPSRLPLQEAVAEAITRLSQMMLPDGGHCCVPADVAILLHPHRAALGGVGSPIVTGVGVTE